VQNRYNAGDRSSQAVADLCDQEQIVFIPWAPIQNTDRNVGLRAAADVHGVTVNQVVLAWLLGQSSQILPIPGSGDADHVTDNVAAAGLQLTAAEQEAITHGG
jgi:pyridoxine 4-dehydrogenase